MNSDLSSYKNIDKSTQVILNENGAFTVVSLDNPQNQSRKFQYDIESGFLQFFFALNNSNTVAFNMEHCAIELESNQTAMVYIPGASIKTLVKLGPQSHLYALIVPVTHFHQLLADNVSIPFNLDFLNDSKNIMDVKDISPAVKVVLHQFASKKIEDHLKPLFIKGKVYELLSHYFNNDNHIDLEKCPFMANSETVAKIKKAKDIILEHMANPPGLEELAKIVGLNMKQLKIGFKEMYGMPVYTFLLNYKLDYAKTLLENEKLNVSEIASLIGYSSSSHFIAAFKKKYGLSPKKYLSA